jgi:predicted ATPase
MRIKALHLQRFRSVQDLTVDFDAGLTTLVGENGVGKSTIGIALNVLLVRFVSGGDPIGPGDYPYGVFAETTIEAVFDLTRDEIENLFLRRGLIPGTVVGEDARMLRRWFANQGSEFRLTYKHGGDPYGTYITWGALQLHADSVSLGGREVLGQGATPWHACVDRLIRGQYGLAGPKPVSVSDGPLEGVFKFGIDLRQGLGAHAMERFKPVADFRLRIASGQRSSVMESMTGSEIASVLLNLKVDRLRSEQDRYRQIVETFRTFFPRFQIDAVEQNSGGGQPEVQFYEDGRQIPLTLNQVGAGVHAVLTMVTNLVGRDALIIFLEHPETHLHPHSMRALASLLREYSDRNQVIVVTHSPYFVNPQSPQSLRRFWWTPEKGTEVRRLEISSLSLNEVNQVGMALRYVGDREVVFARAVLLVEEDSQKEFVTHVAPTLGFDLDARGISVISVGGGDRFGPYLTLVEKLGIPYLALRDDTWGVNPRYPKSRFFALGDSGDSLEKFLDRSGLSVLRQEVENEVGRNKTRVAAALSARLRRGDIPEIYAQVLSAVTTLALEGPSRFS